MLITKTAIQNLQVGFSKVFETAYRDTPTFWQEVATPVTSTTRINTYGWMQRLFAMRKWEGPRLVQNLNTQAYLLENDPYELTVGVDKHDIEDDALGVYNMRFAEMARQGKKLPDQLVKLALQNGATNLSFDNLSFFNANHTLNPAGVQSNTGSEKLDPGVGRGWDVVRAKMTAYTGEDGEPLGVNPNLIVVPPQLETAAKRIVTSELSTNGGTNLQRGEARVLVVPELANEAAVWYAMDVSAPIKPLIWQIREAVQLVAKVNPTDDNVFFLREFIWGLEARGAVGYGPWWLAYRATGGATIDTLPNGVTA